MRIKELRMECGKSQTEVAKILGISQQVFSTYEKESCFPDPNMLIKLARYFNVSVDYLIGNEEPARVEGFSTLKLEPEEEELLRIFRNVSRGGKNILLGNARNIEKNDEYLKKQRRA